MYSYNRPKIDIPLRLLKCAVEDRSYSHVIGTLGKAITAATDRMTAYEENDPGDNNFRIYDENAEFVEPLLGAVYVVCQVRMSEVIGAALMVQKVARKYRIGFDDFSDDLEVRHLGKTLPGRSMSKTEVLWVLANSFKHRGEAEALRSDTLHDLERIGIVNPIESSYLRKGAEVLDNKSYAATNVFSAILDDWSKTVLNETRQRITR